MSKPKACAECGLAIERRGLHPACKELRARRRKADRERLVLARVRSVVPVLLDRATITVPLGWLQQQAVDELTGNHPALLNKTAKDRSLIRRLVKDVLGTMAGDGAVHFSGRRYFLPKMLGERSDAVQ